MGGASVQQSGAALRPECRRRNARRAALALSIALLGAADGRVFAQETDPPWLDRVKEVVEIQTWRQPATDGGPAPNEAQVREAIGEIKGKFEAWIAQAADKPGRQATTLVPFEWKSEDERHWVFGWRGGHGERKVSLLTHLDTVPPGSNDWGPFEPREEIRTYHGAPTRFLVGRGTIDDKGPAVVSLHVLLDVLAELEDDPAALDDVTFELLFDTSEETDLSTTHYHEAHPEEKPALGIVLDAFWCIRAEKGVERPVFSVPVTDALDGLPWLSHFGSDGGTVNQIPGSASARIAGAPAEELDRIAAAIPDWYRAYDFGDRSYPPATLKVARDGDGIVLTTYVAGAQHGSAPEENRARGANPLVSLAHFLAHLRDRDVLGDNHFARMADFMRWGWGTTVFGERHPDLLSRYDTVFTEGNGTTYALTSVDMNETGDAVTLAMDVRYSIGHHATGWDGSEGLIAGDSVFASTFSQLADRYASSPGGGAVTVETATLVGPDIRQPRNPHLSAVDDAFRQVMGRSCPMLAVGGGTDAKGNPELVAAGALFTDSLGPPINFHGLNEGAPIIDLENSAKVLRRILLNEVGR